MMHDKECEADENKIWIKGEIKAQQIGNHTRSYSVVIPKWKRETKKKKRKKYFFSNFKLNSIWTCELTACGGTCHWQRRIQTFR